MAKVKLGPRTLLYPLPTVLVGANVDGKPDFAAFAWCGIVNSRPPMLSVAFQHPRHTLKGVKQNGVFSVNIGSVDMVGKIDYCGMVSGATTDKVADCGFHVFYGKLEHAPMVTECPVNMECKLLHLINLPSHQLVIATIEEVHVTDSCLTDGEPDVEKIKPFLWTGRPDEEYRAIGNVIAKAHAVGKGVKG